MTGEGIVILVGAILTAVNRYYAHKDKAETVKRLKNLQHTADDTHKLVNNRYAIQLKINAIGARALANETQRPEHVKLAEAADFELIEHLRKQAIVDETVAARQETK